MHCYLFFGMYKFCFLCYYNDMKGVFLWRQLKERIAMHKCTICNEFVNIYQIENGNIICLSSSSLFVKNNCIK